MVITGEDSTMVRELGKRYEAAWNARDGAAIAATVAEDYYGVEADGSEISGRAALETMARTELEAMKAVPVTISITTGKTTWLNGTTAISNGTFALNGMPAGAGPEKGSYLIVAVKGSDNQWRVKSALAAPYIPPPPTPPAPPAPGKSGGN